MEISNMLCAGDPPRHPPGVPLGLVPQPTCTDMPISVWLELLYQISGKQRFNLLWIGCDVGFSLLDPHYYSLTLVIFEPLCLMPIMGEKYMFTKCKLPSRQWKYTSQYLRILMSGNCFWSSLLARI